MNVQTKSGNEEPGQQQASKPQNAGRRMRRSRLWTIIAGILFIMPVASQAEEGNIHIGQLRVHPFVSVDETFSDNVFYTATEQKRDTIITYTP